MAKYLFLAMGMLNHCSQGIAAKQLVLTKTAVSRSPRHRADKKGWKRVSLLEIDGNAKISTYFTAIPGGVGALPPQNRRSGAQHVPPSFFKAMEKFA